MEWINLHTSTLDSPEFVGADPLERATWLCLLRFCCGQENGGIIAGCRDWSDRRWQQLCRITKREVTTTSVLWSWQENDLTVWAYPFEKEEEVKRNRIHGALGGRPKKIPENNHPVNQVVIQPVNPPVNRETNQALNPTSNPTQTTGLVSAETEGKGRERKGIGKEEEGNGAADAALPAPLVSPAEKGSDFAKEPASAKPARLTLHEVSKYFLAQGSTDLEAAKFYDYYEANGWMQGKNKPIRNRLAAARNWLRRNQPTTPGAVGSSSLFDASAPHAHTGGYEGAN